MSEITGIIDCCLSFITEVRDSLSLNNRSELIKKNRIRAWGDLILYKDFHSSLFTYERLLYIKIFLFIK